MKILLLFNLLFATLTLVAQDDPLGFEEEESKERLKIPHAFNDSYLINSHSSNVLSKGRLNFLIQHRFGTINQGAFNLYGLDFSAIRFGFEYGVRDWLTIGFGRSSLGKNYDVFTKYRVLTQTTNGGIPFTLTVFQSAALSSVELRNQKKATNQADFFEHLVFTNQLLISKKLSNHLAIQLSPFLVHRNRVIEGEKNNIIGLGIGGKIKLSKRIHLLGDYYYISDGLGNNNYPPLAIGVDIIAGGHVFKVHVGNAVGMIEKEFLTANYARVSDGDLRLGFSVLRSFSINPDIKGGKIK